MNNDVVWHNGEFKPRADAQIAVDDGGWLHGAGLFETMRAENGRVFGLDAHLHRLRSSAQELIRPIDLSELPSKEAFEELLTRNNMPVARVRITVSAGSMLENRPDDKPPMTVVATASPLGAPPAQAYTQGIQVIITEHRVSPSDPIAPHKTIAYLPRLIGLREAHRAKCMEALWFTTGRHLAEGSITNVFVVKDGGLKTPPLGTPVLPGITRAAVLDLARVEKIEATECPLSIDDLLDADEVFLTNVIMLIVPVVRVEKHDIADGRVGPIAPQLHDALKKMIRQECTD